jgi:hypothetical protein
MAALCSVAPAQKFYPDDPLWRDPPPRNATAIKGRKLSEYYDYFSHQFAKPGERHPKAGPAIPAQNVNTLGEVPSGPWYENRHYFRRMTIAELVRGPGNERPPDLGGPLKVVSAKNEGVTPGFTMIDRKGDRYFVKFDPKSNPEMASAADVIVAKFFYALGYHVPENYIAYLNRDQLVIAPDTRITDARGKHRKMDDRDLVELLMKAPLDEERGYRAVASLALPGKPAGPFRYHGTRRDDPNDVVRHEHRRELRGLYVFAAWLGHNDVKSLNSLDTLVEENGVAYLKHFLLDFGAALGSDSFTAKSPRAGNEYLFGWNYTFAQLFSLGLFVPRWARAHFPDIPAAGNFEYKVFDPLKWKPNYPIPAFDNRLPADTFWAARQVMAFTDDEIRALVATGEFSDPEAAEWLAKCLIERRDKIGRAYLADGIPLDRFRVEGGRLEFDDLAVRYLAAASRDWRIGWSEFDNASAAKTSLSAGGAALPEAARSAPAGSYFAADIRAPGDERRLVTVYVRKSGGAFKVVGVDRIF